MSRTAKIVESETCISRRHIKDAQLVMWMDSKPVINWERITLRDALRRITCEDICSPINVPSCTNSAVDGYAVCHDDLVKQKDNCKLTIAGTAWAGKPYKHTLRRGQAIRIMTGAVMPEGCDTVIMQENAQVLGSDVAVAASTCTAGQNVRQAGEDLTKGSIAIAKGKRLTAADLGLLASLGINEINVYRKLRVAFFSTGNELRGVGQPLGEGEIYDSNRYTLFGMLQNLDMDITDLGVVADNQNELSATLEMAAKQCDAVITSGGVSVGDADYMRQAIEQIGNIYFWQVAIKPGRPLVYGRIHNTPFFGLPGNPVAVMVTFYQLVQPALLSLAGETPIAPPQTYKARSADAFRKRPGRTEFQRAVLQTNDQGELWVQSTGKQGSGILRSMSEANCFVVLPHDAASVRQGDWVDVQPFEGVMR